jgi:hypothetical protein
MQLLVDRDRDVDQFVALAVDHYEGYRCEGLKVSFLGEDGIDCGGPRRELFSIIADPLLRRALVPAGVGDILWFPRNEACDPNHVNDLIAVGFLLRLVIETRQSVTSLLPLPFFSVLKEDPMTLADMERIHPETAAAMIQAEEAYNNGETIPLYLGDGREVTVDLFPTYVTENIKSSMETQIATAVDAVRRGFHGGKKPSWASSFSSSDLDKRVSGPTVIDWTEMKSSCQLRDYSPDDISVRLFWQIFDSLDEKGKVALLLFITASDRPPAMGFASSPIKLQKCQWNPVAQRPFPKAHTCFNTLDLPNVTDEARMRQLIQMCVEYTLGFGFG